MRFFLIILFSIFLNSCIVKKRVHRNGWYIQWINDSKTARLAKNIEISKVEYSYEKTEEIPDTQSQVQKVDTTMSRVYNELNSFRSEINLSSITLDESLELAAAQHGCWLALYNYRIDTSSIVLQSNETDLYLAKKLNDPIDRVKMYTSREIFFIQEYLNYYYHNPTSEEIFLFMKNKLVSKRYQHFGYWVIKYETKKHRPIWYLVFLITD